MTSLVDGYRALLGLGHYLGFLLQTANDTVYGIEEVLLAHLLTVEAGGYQCGLITDVGNIGTRETGRLAGQEVNIDTFVELQRLQVHHKHLLALVQVWQVHMYLAVKAAGTKQGGVEHIGTVGSGQGNDAAISAETVHLRQ